MQVTQRLSLRQIDGGIHPIDVGLLNRMLSNLDKKIEDKFLLGVVGHPSVSAWAAPATGLYWPGTAILGAAVSGVQRQRWTTTGTVVTGTLNVTGAVTLDSTLTVTGVAQFNNGTTVTTPGITFTGDLNTGLGWVSADIFRFIAGGSERGRVNGTGTVTTPLWRLSGDGAVNWTLWLTALANPSFPQLFITQHATPGSINGCLTALVYDPDNVAIGFDTGTQGGWIARDSSIAVLYKTGAEFRIYGSTGNTPGGAAALTLRWAMALGTGGITQSGALVITATGNALDLTAGDIQVGRSSTGTVGVDVINTSNTGSAHAQLELSTAGASAGDPYIMFTIVGVQNWSLGFDNSDSDKFKLATGTSPGGTALLTIDTSGNMIVAGTLTVSGTGISTFAGPIRLTAGGNGGGNFPTVDGITIGTGARNITFLSDSAGTSVDGIIGSWNTTYNFQNSKIVFDKPSANIGQILLYTQNGSGITLCATFRNDLATILAGTLTVSGASTLSSTCAVTGLITANSSINIATGDLYFAGDTTTKLTRPGAETLDFVIGNTATIRMTAGVVDFQRAQNTVTGTTATIGGIGDGPGAAAQSGWLLVRVNGNTRYIPIWA